MSDARLSGAATRANGAVVREPEGLPQRLATLEQLMNAELGTLCAGTAPLLDTLRQGARVLKPGPGGTRPAPKEREAWRERLLQSLDVLEDVLEGLQLASRADAAGRKD